MEAQNNSPVTPIAPVTASTETQVIPTVETPKDDISASRFAALARKEKQAVAAAKMAKDEQAKLATDRAEIAKWKEEQAKPKAKKNPIEALMAEGWTYADASAYVMNDDKPTPEHMVKDVESKFEAYKREQEEKELAKTTREEEELKAAQTKQIEDFKASITTFLSEKADTYELIAMHDAQNLVFDTISEHYDRTLATGKPVILSTEEAANLVEGYLEERVKSSLNAKKFKSKDESADNKSDKPGAVAAFTGKTLSNSVTSTSSNPKSPPRDDDERRQRAIALIG
jgi:hypothetical protein